MKIRPLGDHIVVKPIKKEETTASGIVLPDTMDEKKKAEGEVVAVGLGRILKSGQRGQMEVMVGQRILFKKWGGDEVEVDGVEYKIISQEDVLAVLE